MCHTKGREREIKGRRAGGNREEQEGGRGAVVMLPRDLEGKKKGRRNF